MNLYNFRIVVLAMALPALTACGGTKPEKDTESPPPATNQGEEAVFEEDFEDGDAQEWAETEASEEPISDEAAAAPEKE